jgi:hypothetical protein
MTIFEGVCIGVFVGVVGTAWCWVILDSWRRR